MVKQFTYRDICDKIAEIVYQDCREIDYRRMEKGIDEYDISLTIKTYYDSEGRLRKRTTESYFGSLETVELFNECGNLIYTACAESVELGNKIRIKKYFFDGSKEENVIRSLRLLLHRSDLTIEIDEETEPELL